MGESSAVSLAIQYFFVLDFLLRLGGVVVGCILKEGAFLAFVVLELVTIYFFYGVLAFC